MKNSRKDSNQAQLAEATLVRANACDLEPLIRRYVQRRNTSAQRARAIADELKRFLVVCSIESEKGFIVSGEVDEMWHMFILFTRRYADFCETVAGRFIHHVPGEDMAYYYSEPDTPHTYAETLTTYKRFFGDDPNPTIWPTPSSGDVNASKQDPFPCEGGGGSGPQACGVPKNPGDPGTPGFP